MDALSLAMQQATQLSAESGEDVYFVVARESVGYEVTTEWPAPGEELFRAYPGGRRILSMRGKDLLYDEEMGQ